MKPNNFGVKLRKYKTIKPIGRPSRALFSLFWDGQRVIFHLCKLQRPVRNGGIIEYIECEDEWALPGGGVVNTAELQDMAAHSHGTVELSHYKVRKVRKGVVVLEGGL